ncbi:cilia- and flagella-associated protein 337-like [Convolutriloba macropyga]|uniref:cilia- and flagella-associated protein 337-like n=1 Tax=Convolutriloba macropyga TaxID=536237 RepID=UPI003F51D289
MRPNKVKRPTASNRKVEKASLRWHEIVGKTVMAQREITSASARTGASSRMSAVSSHGSGAANQGGGGSGGSQQTSGSSIDQETGQEDLIRMQEIFEEADEDGGGGLDIDEFKVAMKKVLGSKTDDRELEKLFMKVDTNCDGTVDWDEFLSYMLLEYLEKDLIKAMMAELPFSKDEVEVPRKHSSLIVRIRHVPLTRSVSFTHSLPIPGRGRYYSIDESGIVNTWSGGMQHTRKLRCPPRGQVPLCCRDIAVLTNLSLVLVASTLNELWFFDVSKFEKQCTVTRLPYSVECMHYQYNYNNSNQSHLLWGDTGGNVFIIALSESLQTGFFSEAYLNSKKEMPLEVYSSGKFPHCKLYQHRGIHGSWTRQIKFLSGSSQFISCSWSSQSSMVVSLLRENGRPPYIFNVTKGL